MRAPAAQLRSLRLRGERPPATAEPRVSQAAPAEDVPARWPMHWVLAACLAVAGLTLLLPTTPTYDPWAWLLWGRQVVEGDLVTTGGPSWKPLPMLFIVPFQGVGEVIGSDKFAPYAWVWISRAGGLLACVMSFRLARRLTGGGALGWLAGVVAFASLFSSFKFARDSALGNSEPLMAALVLWAFERHLDGRRDHALYLASGAALMRPEIWPFLGLYGLWLWFREPQLRLRMGLICVGILALWFVPEKWGSGDWFRAANRANDPRPDSPAFADQPALEILRRYKGTLAEPIAGAGALAALVAGVRYFRRLGPGSERRRDWATLVIAAGGLAWLALVAGMTEGGYAGNQRYLIIPTAALAVLAGIGVARIPEGVRWFASSRVSPRLATGLAVLSVAAFALPALPVINSKTDQISIIADDLEYEARLWDELGEVIDEAGGDDALIACKGLFSGSFQTQMIAYELHLPGIRIGIQQPDPPPPGDVRRRARWLVPPAAIFRTRTASHLRPVPIVPPGEGYGTAAATRHWRILTSPEGAPGCPPHRGA